MIVSVHHYELAVSTTPTEFHDAVRDAERRGLFDLPGLIEHRFLRGIRGSRRNEFTAVWTYESREAWERLWGPVDDPITTEEYPEQWKQWEDDVLAPLVAGDPDEIDYTSYEVIDTTGDE